MAQNQNQEEQDVQLMDDMRGAYQIPAWESKIGWAYLSIFVVAIAWLVWILMNANPYTIMLTLTVLLVISMSTSCNGLHGFGGYILFVSARLFGMWLFRDA